MKPDLCSTPGLSRRGFVGTAAGAGAALALSPQILGAEHRHRFQERRTWFFNLAHEQCSGHEYHLILGRHRHRLRPLEPGDPAIERARRTNRFLRGVPDSSITHIVENVLVPAREVIFTYVTKDADTTSGTWQMSAVYLVPPKYSFRYAYSRATAGLESGAALPLSAKRRKYGLPAAVTLDDLLEEEVILDPTDWATALVNLHPELLSVDPDSAAHIQVSHIRQLPATSQLSEVLSAAGAALPQIGSMTDNATGWATLVPYTDSAGAPLLSTKGNNAGLILYDPQWQPGIKNPFIRAAMGPALQSAKADVLLGVDVTGSPSEVPTGAIWTRHDAVTSIEQPPVSSRHPSRHRESAANVHYTLTNNTPSFGGYLCTSSTSTSGGNSVVTLTFTNWYVRYLGLFIQFKNNQTVVSISSLPPGIGPEDPFITAKNELLLGPLNPEFTIYGIPIQSSGNTVTFTFPSSVATSATILASGLGVGSHTSTDTEVLGIVMTSLFNLIIPAGLLALGIATSIDIFVKTLAIPYALLVAREIATVVTDGNAKQVATLFWRAVVKGAVGPALKLFLGEFLTFLEEYEVIDGLEDAIPIAGEIIQAIGIIGTVAELAETTAEVLSSPWTYVYDLVGTYDFSLTISPDPTDHGGFPSTAATYKVTAIFDNAAPNLVTLNMPSGSPKTVSAQFTDVPLGGSVTLTVGFYASDGTQVGHGTTGSIPNLPTTSPAITIKELPVPIDASTVYHHRQKTTLDAEGNHLWTCTAQPPASALAACGPAPGQICNYRSITFNATLGNIGYAWRSFSTNACNPGGMAQLDQMASIPNADSGPNAQGGYAALPCALSGSALLIYDPLGRPSLNFYLDMTDNINLLRNVALGPTVFSDPRGNLAWGKFNLPADDMLLHPSGAVITINKALSRMETLTVPAAPVTDAEAAVSLLANLHGGFGSRPGLFNAPAVATITSEGVVLVVEAGNNRIHALDISGNPVRHFPKQPEPYFLSLTATAATGTVYLDAAVEFSGLIYVLSLNSSVYRLDIYDPALAGTAPVSTTMGFNAARVTVDYWRNVYALNYEVLTFNGTLPANGVTEPSVSQWTPTTPTPCQAGPVRSASANLAPPPGRLLRRRDLLSLSPART